MKELSVIFWIFTLVLQLSHSTGFSSFGAMLFGRSFSAGNRQVLGTFGDEATDERNGCNPSVYGGEKFSSVTYRGKLYKCAYYECEAEINANLRRWKYHLKFCPNGQGITTELISRGKIGGRTPPCHGNPRCRKSLAEKGVYNMTSPICMVDFAVLLDTCKLSSAEKTKVQTFVLNLISAVPIGRGESKVAIASYEDDVVELLKFHSADDQRTALILFDNKFNTEDTSVQCGTESWKVIKHAYQDLFTGDSNNRLDMNDTVVLITDGTSLGSNETTTWADELKTAGVNVLVVHVSNTTGGEEKELKGYASDSVNGYWSVPDTEQLGEIEDEVVARTCSKK